MGTDGSKIENWVLWWGGNDFFEEKRGNVKNGCNTGGFDNFRFELFYGNTEL